MVEQDSFHSPQFSSTVPISTADNKEEIEKQIARDKESIEISRKSGIKSSSMMGDDHPLETSEGTPPVAQPETKPAAPTETKPEWVQDSEWKGTIKATMEALRSAKHFEKKADDKKKEGEKPAANVGNVAELFNDENQKYFKADLAKNNGKLSDEAMAKIKATGLPQEVADQWLEGQNALLEVNRLIAVEALGGQEAYEKKTAWFATLPEEEQRLLGPHLQSNVRAVVRTAAKQIDALYFQANGREPKLMSGRSPASPGEMGPKPWKDEIERMRAYKHPIYDKSGPEAEAYRQEVYDRELATVNKRRAAQ